VQNLAEISDASQVIAKMVFLVKVKQLFAIEQNLTDLEIRIGFQLVASPQYKSYQNSSKTKP